MSSRSVQAAVFAASALAVAVVAGCGADGAREGEPAIPSGSWQLVSGTTPAGRIQTVPTHRITLVVEGDRVGGTAACNSYGGQVRIDGDRLDVSGLSQTEMACEPPVMAAEAAYLGALQDVDTIRQEGAQLVLAGAAVELRFDLMPATPRRGLLETLWELETVIDGDVASTTAGPTATLRLRGDGTLEGETGCRAFRGRYVLRGDEIQVTGLAVDDAAAVGACSAAAVEQDRIVLQVIGDGFRAAVEGNRLTLTSASADALVYQAP